MKKIFGLILVALLVTSVAFAATPGYKLGHGKGDVMGGGGRYAGDPHKTFRMVRYMPVGGSTLPDVATLVTGSIVVWDVISDDGVTVTTTTTSYDSAVAGITVVATLTPELAVTSLPATQDTSKRSFTWLQTYGKCTVRVQSDSSEVDAGDAMSCGDDAGEATDFIGGGTSASTQGMAGFFYDDATAGQDDVECFLTLD